MTRGYLPRNAVDNALENECEARAIFVRLGELDPTLTERNELAEVGVPQRRIDALYPYDFANFVPAILAATPAGFLDDDEIDSSYWDWLTESVRSHIGQFAPPLQEELRAHAHDFLTDQRGLYDSLYFHLYEHVPAIERGDRGVNAMLYALINLCWLVNRSLNVQLQHRRLSYKRTHALFVKVMHRILPKLA